MKKIVLKLLSLIIVVSASAFIKDNSNLHINGIVKNVDSGKVYLQKFQNKMYVVIDSTEIVNGKFKFSKNVELPEIYGLTLDTLKSTYLLFLEKNPISVQLDSSSYYRNTVVTGSESQDLYLRYTKERNIKIDEFIKENPKSLVSAYVLYRFYSYRLSSEEIKSNIQLLDSSLWKTPYVKVLEELAKTIEKVSIGKKAPDFIANDTLDNPIKLSDHLGKGYVLLDFWAAWCGPCRRENPHVVQAYNKYKNKGFDIFAVSLDKSKEKWIQAIAKDNLTWTHVSDLLYWDSEPAKLYGVRGIPANFLIDKDGVIVAKNLRGKELDDILGELLK